jgi:hypothetical protein
MQGHCLSSVVHSLLRSAGFVVNTSTNRTKPDRFDFWQTVLYNLVVFLSRR